MKKPKKNDGKNTHQALDIDHLLEKAIKFYRENEYDKAGRLYDRILKTIPDHPKALHHSGLVEYQLGKKEHSIRRIERAVQLEPSNIGYLKNLCAILAVTGSVDKAIGYLEKTLVLSPDSLELWLELGNSQQKQGKFSEAVKAYKMVLAIQPDHADAYHNMGTALHGKGEYDQAIACYHKVLKLKPELPEAMYNLGNSLREIGSIEEAIGAMHKAISIKPDYLDALFNLAKMVKDTGQTEAAILTYTKLLKINPTFSEAYNNLGNLFYDLGQTDQARDCYTQALIIKKDYPEAIFNMGIALQDQGEIQAAMAYSKRAIALKPDYAEAISSLVHQMREACEWVNLNDLDSSLDKLTRQALSKNQRPAEGPFLNLSRCDDPALNFAVARSWSRELVSQVRAINAFHGKRAFEFDHRKRPDEKITIGYLSNNFRNHPLAHLVCSLFGSHDRKRFKVNCYSYGKDDGSHYRQQIKDESDRFVDLLNVNDRDASAIIHEDKVDILIDLTGYMKGHRLGICAQRPAPLQVRYLGLAGTTGAAFFDYIIADAIAIPQSHQAYYTEKLVYLPHCYQINNRQQSVANITYAREDFGLPSEGFVFCAFSSHYKLDPIMFATWMKILAAVKESVLWLIPGSETAQLNLKQQARAHGIDDDRIVFATRLPKSQHLARIKLADIALDTRIVGGAATTSDALWAGVPVISLIGRHFASRMSGSLLEAVGLPELVCDSLDAYESLAIGLARDQQRLFEIRAKLSKNKMTEPLFDSGRTVRSLETAFTSMWENYTQGHGPRPFMVQTN